jgi:hypothetical protein
MENIIKTGKNDKDFEGIKWAIAARANKDDMRFAVRCVRVEMGCVIATNGHRLHIATTDRDIPDGTYRVVTEVKDTIILELADKDDNGFPFTYPDYERVFPTHTHNGIADLSTHTKAGKGVEISHETNVLNHVLRQSQNCFNVKYLIDACPMNEDLHFEQCGESGDMRPLVIRNQDYTKAALVMPYKDK